MYRITLLAAIYHPLDGVMVAVFEFGLVASTQHEADGIRTDLNLPELNYESEDGFMLRRTISGFIGNLAYTVPYIELHGIIDYQSIPSNGHTYREQITFPRVYLRHAEFSLYLVSTSLEQTENNLLIAGERALCRASITNIINFGPAADMVVFIEVNEIYLSIISTELFHVG